MIDYIKQFRKEFKNRLPLPTFHYGELQKDLESFLSQALTRIEQKTREEERKKAGFYDCTEIVNKSKEKIRYEVIKSIYEDTNCAWEKGKLLEALQKLSPSEEKEVCKTEKELPSKSSEGVMTTEEKEVKKEKRGR